MIPTDVKGNLFAVSHFGNAQGQNHAAQEGRAVGETLREKDMCGRNAYLKSRVWVDNQFVDNELCVVLCIPVHPSGWMY